MTCQRCRCWETHRPLQRHLQLRACWELTEPLDSQVALRARASSCFNSSFSIDMLMIAFRVPLLAATLVPLLVNPKPRRCSCLNSSSSVLSHSRAGLGGILRSQMQSLTVEGNPSRITGLLLLALCMRRSSSSSSHHHHHRRHHHTTRT